MGEGLELDGSGDYVWKNDGTAIDLEQDWSMEAWVYMDDNLSLLHICRCGR